VTEGPEIGNGGVGYDPKYHQLEIVAYVGDFRIVGMASFSAGARASSRRSSDYIRQINDARLTLSNVRIYNKNTLELFETAPFVILNMEKVDFLYAREEGAAGSPHPGAASAP
jgi:hypothetical protein